MSTLLSRREMVAVGLGAALATPRRAAAAGPKPMRGIFPILATPYTASGAVDYEDLAKEVDYFARWGVHGMVWPQSASEYLHLSKEERFEGMRVLAKAAKGRKPALVLGVQAPNLKGALEYASYAEELAPDALIAMPPSEATSLDDYRVYYRALARLAGRPLFMQTTGGARNVPPTVEFIVELAREFPNFGYIKEEYAPLYERIARLAGNRPPIKAVFSGPLGTYEMRLGCDGAMPGAHFADLDVKVWDLYQSAQTAKAYDLFSRRALIAAVAQQIPGTRPYIMKKRGVFKTTVSRREHATLTPQAMAEIDANLEVLRPYLIS